MPLRVEQGKGQKDGPLRLAVAAAANEAGIDKRISMHSLRHAFATPPLLEQGFDIRLILVLLDHKKLETSALYGEVTTDILRKVVSPLEKLNLAWARHWAARPGGRRHLPQQCACLAPAAGRTS